MDLKTVPVWWRKFVAGAKAGLCYFRAWREKHPATAMAVVMPVVILGGMFVVLWITGLWSLILDGARQALTAYREIKDHKDQVEAFGKLVPAIGLILAAPVALLGFALAYWRTWNQHQDREFAARKLEAESNLAIRKLDAESFAKAVEQLGHNETAIQMGAVLALQALGETSPRLTGQVIEILCAYIREKRPWRPSVFDNDYDPHGFDDPDLRLPTNIQLILDAICRLNTKSFAASTKIDLSSSCLPTATLRGVNLANANLSGSILASVDFAGADLQGTQLRCANLTRADLTSANLFGADLASANLSGAILTGTILDPERQAED